MPNFEKPKENDQERRNLEEEKFGRETIEKAKEFVDIIHELDSLVFPENPAKNFSYITGKREEKKGDTTHKPLTSYNKGEEEKRGAIYSIYLHSLKEYLDQARNQKEETIEKNGLIITRSPASDKEEFTYRAAHEVRHRFQDKSDIRFFSKDLKLEDKKLNKIKEETEQYLKENPPSGVGTYEEEFDATFIHLYVLYNLKEEINFEEIAKMIKMEPPEK